MILRTYLAGLGEVAPALRQQIAVHCCRTCRLEWRETLKGSVPARVSEHKPTQVVEVNNPEEQRELERSSHVGSRAGDAEGHGFTDSRGQKL